MLSYCSTVLIVTLVFLISGKPGTTQATESMPERSIIRNLPDRHPTTRITLKDEDLDNFYRGDSNPAEVLPFLVQNYKSSLLFTIGGTQNDLERLFFVLRHNGLENSSEVKYVPGERRVRITLRSYE